ncbi:MAG: hypothetical protein NT080_09365 [Spirochaetes bacterium]|nr:hypothetical protein [Spirochaetota bacterium]
MHGRSGALFLATLLALSGASAWAQAGGTLSAEEQKTITACLPEARDIVLAGLDSGNHLVKEAAIRMLRHLPPKLAYEPVLALFQDPGSEITTPGFALFRDAALETLFSLDPARTLDWLRANEESIWNWIGPQGLFAMIGYDKITQFSNLFLLGLDGGRKGAFGACLLSRKYLETKDRRYLDLLVFYPWDRDVRVDEYSRLYLDFKAKKLPLDRIVYAMQDRAGILKGREPDSRSFTLDELLFQALLYRLKLSRTVVATGVTPGNGRLSLDADAARKYGIPVPAEAERNPVPSAVFPSTVVNNALAFFLAGVPEKKHLKDFQDLLSTFPAGVQYRYAGIVADSPDSIQRTACLEFLLDREDPNLGRIALRGFLAGPEARMPDRVITLLSGNGDILVRAAALELVGRQGKGKHSLLLRDFMREDNNPLLRVVAAGNLLAVYGVTR